MLTPHIAMSSLIETLEGEMTKDHVTHVMPGDTIEVHYLIREGEKERIQLFTGTIIAIQGSGIRRAMVVRRIVQGEGVERIFPMHNPRVKDIVVTRRGRARRAKLYFLRDRVGKKTRVREWLGDKARAARLSDAAIRKDQAAKAEATKSEAVEA